MARNSGSTAQIRSYPQTALSLARFEVSTRISHLRMCAFRFLYGALWTAVGLAIVDEQDTAPSILDGFSSLQMIINKQTHTER